jgi:Skp family chaperone for outer membrane proteins
MNKTTAVLATITALLVGALLVGACSDSGPVGFVDVDKVVAESRAGKEFKVAADEGNTKVEDLKAAAERANQAYRKSIEDKLKDEDQRPLMVAAGKANQAYQVEVKRQKESAGVMENQINVAIARVAQARGMKLVIPVSGKPPYYAPSADVTTETVARLDAATDEVTKLRGELAAARADLKKGGPGK